MPDKRFAMSLDDAIKIIVLHCGCDYDKYINPENQNNYIYDIPSYLKPYGSYSGIRVVLVSDNKYLYVYAYKGESTDLNLLKLGFLKKNWMLRYSDDSVDMRYKPDWDWDVYGFLHGLYDRITWESLKEM